MSYVSLHRLPDHVWFWIYLFQRKSPACPLTLNQLLLALGELVAMFPMGEKNPVYIGMIVYVYFVDSHFRGS
jgi:hypothetical protein